MVESLETEVGVLLCLQVERADKVFPPKIRICRSLLHDVAAHSVGDTPYDRVYGEGSARLAWPSVTLNLAGADVRNEVHLFTADCTVPNELVLGMHTERVRRIG